MSETPEREHDEAAAPPAGGDHERGRGPGPADEAPSREEPDLPAGTPEPAPPPDPEAPLTSQVDPDSDG